MNLHYAASILAEGSGPNNFVWPVTLVAIALYFWLSGGKK